VLAASLFTGFVFSAVAATPNPAPDAPPKDHVLFVGTDLAVKQDGQYYRVIRATKDALLIERDHGVTEMRRFDGAEIRVTRGVKLSNLSATIDKLRTDSVDRAAARAQFDAMHEQIMLTDQANTTADRLHGEMIRAGSVAVDPNAAMGSAAASVEANKAATTAAYVNALPALESNVSAASTFFFEKTQRSETAEVALSFELSSPEPIENAYLVVVANYTAGDKITRHISARELKRIDRRPRRVELIHPASISGLEFKNFAIGLYASGQEIATNLSEKRMPLTKDQAFQFFLIDYLSKHPGATTPPTPMVMIPRAEFRGQIDKTHSSQPIFATVDKSGTVIAMSTDEAGAQKLPASVQSALQNVRFMPALKNGTPVDGRVKVTLAELANN
jgi:hypothetical protein